MTTKRTTRAVLVLALLLLGVNALPVPAIGALGPPAQVAAPSPTLAQVQGGFSAPVFVTHAGDGSNRLFVVERGGTIKVVVDGGVQSTPFLDISDRVKSGGEQGLLGLAFHPEYAANGRFFVFYTALGSPSGVGNNTLARYRIPGDPNVADRDSGTVLLSLPDDYGNHNGGMVAFGPDRYLYVGTGDEGSGGDPKNNAQNLNSLYGKLLRLDVSGDGYSVASTNPFVNRSETRGEIWAYGLRNPWRWSFDRGTGDIYIGDVGQGALEEIDFQSANSRGGENYGWKVLEGTRCYGVATCSQGGLTLPISEYGRDLGCSITGGYVYRGSAIPSLVGAYLFADYCTGRIWSLRRVGGSWARTELLDTTLQISSFGEDWNGELYVVDLSGGAIYRLTDPTSTASPTPTATPAAKPDLIVTALSAESVTADSPVPVNVTIANRGTASSNVTFHLHVYADVQPPTTADVPLHFYPPTLAPGQSLTMSDDFPAGRLAAGSHTLWAWIDGHEQVSESDEGNNTRSAPVSVRATPTNPPTAVAATTTPPGTPAPPPPPARPDPLPALSIEDQTVRETDADGRHAVFTVTLSAPSRDTVTVDFKTGADTAQAGSDFRASSGTVTFRPGETAHTVRVPIVADDRAERSERFTVSLRNARNATIADGRGTAIIRDDDNPR